MVPLRFSSLNDVIKELANKYAIFCSDFEYYKKIATPFSNLSLEKTFNKAENEILIQIRNSLKDDNDWFIKFVESEINSRKSISKSLNNIGNLCKNWRLEIDIDTLKTILDKSRDFSEALSQVITVIKEATITNIENYTSNRTLVDILVGYATINNILKEDEEERDDEEDSVDINSFYSDDSVRLYLKEIGSIPLLTPEEERELSLKAKEGSQAAKDAMIEHNLRLAVSVAKRYLGRGLEFNDLIQAGNEGLMKAVDKYDPEKGYKFSTYATWWIRQSIDRTVKDEGRSIRIPVHLHDTYKKLTDTRKRLMGTYGESVSWKDVADELGMPLKQVEDIVSKFSDAISMNSFVGEDEDTEFGDFLSNPDDPTPEQVAMTQALADSLGDILSTLSYREERVLRLRFGVQNPNDPDPDYNSTHTLEEVGALFNLTRERIRQIEFKALRKLRSPARRYKLAGFYPGSEAAERKMNQDSRRARRNEASTSGTNRETDRKSLKVYQQGDEGRVTPKPSKDIVVQNSESRIEKQPEQGGTTLKEESKMSKGKRREGKYFYEVLECTPEEFRLVKYFIKSKKSDSYRVFYLVYGDDLEQVASFDKIDEKQRARYNSSVYVIRTKLDTYRRSYFYSLRESLELDEEDYKIALEYIKGLQNKEVIEAVHGKDFSIRSNTYLLTSASVAEYNKIIGDTRAYVKEEKNVIGLRQIIECPVEYWDDFRGYLCHRYHEVLSPIFGEDLTLELNAKKLADKTNDDLQNAIIELKAKLAKVQIYAGKDLITIANIPETFKESVIQRLKDNASLVALFGEDLLANINIRAYLEMGEEGFDEVMNVVKERKKLGLTLQETLHLEDEDKDIVTAINASLDINTTHRDALRNAFGPKLLSNKDPKVDVSPILTKMKLRVKDALIYKNKTIYEIAAVLCPDFKLTPSNIIKLRSYLLSSKSYNAFSDLFGSDLDKPIDLSMFFAADGRQIFSLMNKNLTKLIESSSNHTPYDEMIESYENKYLDEIFGQTICPIEDIKAYVSRLDVDLIALLRAVHGENLDQLFNATNPILTLDTVKKYETAIATIKNLYTYVQNPNATITATNEEPFEPALTSTINNPAPVSNMDLMSYNLPLFREAIKVVPIEYRYILMLHLGLQDEGIPYSVDDLMIIFNRTKAEIEDALLRGKIFFDEIVAAYQKAYQRSFPMEELRGETRKRVAPND